MGEHDPIFKRAFRVPEHAAGEFLAVLPKEIAAILDPSSLALVETDLVFPGEGSSAATSPSNPTRPGWRDGFRTCLGPFLSITQSNT